MTAAVTPSEEKKWRDLIADCDRMAKRCADLELRLSVASKAEEHARAQVDAYHEIGATRRLSALEQRVGALVEAMVEWCADDDVVSGDEVRSRLAALRSPDPFHAQVERDAILDGLRAQLAAAERERDEAAAILRDFRAWGRGRGSSLAMSQEKADALDALLARALVAGQGVVQESEAGESLRSQVDRLAAYILSDVPGEPSQSQGAIDTAIRVMGQSRSVLVARDAELEAARGLIERAEAYLAAAVRLRTPREYPTVLLDDLRRYLGGA